MSRFSEPQDPLFAQMNVSLPVDRRLWPQDVAQSRAHAKMLAAQGIIADADRDAIDAALDAVETELLEGRFPFEPADEDIHMAIERRVSEIAGPAGRRLRDRICRAGGSGARRAASMPAGHRQRLWHADQRTPGGVRGRPAG